MKNFSLFEKEERIECKPFIKWVGGKGQLLPEINKLYPIELGKTINKYAEIFIGGGAVLFDILSKYKLDEVYISDKNLELINAYKSIRDNIDILIKSLKEMEEEYIPLDDENRKIYYYEKRQKYNKLKINIEENNIEKASLFIFLNKTCFNGLYRVNKKGEFNVPMGAYKNPKICDKENLKNVSMALKNVKIIYADYRESESFIDEKTFVYIDPPYRPLNTSSSFTSYTENDFSDKEQIELAEYIDLLNKKKAKIVISNSDPKNNNIDDNFFDELYKNYNINRVKATRMLNSNASLRGAINELLITNYERIEWENRNMRNFEKWLGKFKNSIATYDYYIDLKKVIKNVDNIKIELNILNSLIGSKNIEKDFENIIKKYPETLKCIPILLAIRDTEIYAQDEEGSFLYNFKTPNYNIEQYKIFMKKTGLFDLIQNHLINNLVDYVLGVETGLDSNGRKNRGGHLMEDLVEKYIIKAGFIKGINYFKEMKISEIEEKFKIDLSQISNNGKTVKRFDFVIKTQNMIYAIETNFYASSGSKLNETARSYKHIAQEAKDINGFIFVWFTDGKGWLDARNNLKETFEILENIYNIDDMENNIVEKLFV
ncbi:DNA adenine methylase [Fusobacterium sp. OBRC1]|nr:DpnII family type II restriction endonuclease [Fusobacterium sp. OBRC1]EUB31434.1 DNA adenine methylase [Fusobacterium sp. OBRC1]